MCFSTACTILDFVQVGFLTKRKKIVAFLTKIAFWNYWADSATFCRFHKKGRVFIVKLTCILPLKNDSKCENAKEIQRIWHLVSLKVLCRITGKLWQILREYVFENTFVASCNFVCIPHFISAGQISSVFSRTNEKNFSDGKIVVRDDVSLRSGLLVDYFGSSRQKNTSYFHEKKICLLFWNALYEFQFIRLWKFLLGAMLTLLI